MRCESCNAPIPGNMRGALRNNVCPYCGEELMNEMKAEQYYNLLVLLDTTQFTNRPDLDSQIRDKVANLMVSQFVFRKISSPQEEDIVLVETPSIPTIEVSPEPVEVAQPQPKPKKQSRKKQKAKARPPESPLLPEKKVSETGKVLNDYTEEDIENYAPRTAGESATPKKPSYTELRKQGLSEKDYLEALKNNYIPTDTDEEQQPAPLPEMSAEQMKQVAAQQLQKDMERLQNTLPKRGGTGAGIRRKER